MRHHFVPYYWGVVLCLQTGCGDGAKEPPVSQDRSSTIAPPLVVVKPTAMAVPPHDSVSAHPVDWTIDRVLDRLSTAGLQPTRSGAVRESFIGAPGSLVNIPGAELEVFIYGDANAAGRDIDQFDTLTVAPHGVRYVWRKPPALVTANNLVLIVLTSDPTVRKRVRAVFDGTDKNQRAPPQR